MVWLNVFTHATKYARVRIQCQSIGNGNGNDNNAKSKPHKNIFISISLQPSRARLCVCTELQREQFSFLNILPLHFIGHNLHWLRVRDRETQE